MESFVEELSAPEGLPFRYGYSSPTQNTDSPQKKCFDRRQVHVFQATKWLAHGFFGDTEYPLGG